MNWKKIKLGDVLRQYRIEHIVQDDTIYKQITISKNSGISLRGEKKGVNIGRKRQFIIDLDKYPNTLLFVRQGVQDGAIGIAPKEVNGCIATENMPMFSIENIDIEYLDLFLKSPFFFNQLRLLEATGSAQKAIHERALLNLDLLVPDKEHQKYIVERINNSLNKITNLSNHLTHQLTLLENLNQAILQEAVQGKLVPQDKNDEPASELLKRIKEEKLNSIGLKPGAKKTLNRSGFKPAPIQGKEIPFEIPENWVWCRLGEICSKIGSGSTPKGSNYSNTGYPFFRSQNILNEGLIYDDIKFISEEVQKQMNGTVVFANDILLNITGGSLGRCTLVPNDFEEGNVSQHVCIIRPIKVDRNYFHKIILSPYFQKLIFSSTTGAGREGLPKYNLEQFLIPLPPLSEQKRIVAEIEKQFEKTKQLKEHVLANQEATEHLLKALLHQAFEQKE